MIPKIIHYVWFGHGKMSPLMLKCIRSWKKYCPDYEIMEWNEDNFDVNSTAWTLQAYAAGKYAFVADYVRLYALQKYGGIYMDTDQELVKSLDPFLKSTMFLGFMDTQISAGLIGASANSKILSECLDYYKYRQFLVDGQPDLTPNTRWMTALLETHGLLIKDEFQKVGDADIYPRTYFCPTNCDSIHKFISPKTVAIHHWAMTWRSEKAKKSFRRARRHQRAWYRTWIYLRYLPHRIVRAVFGSSTIDRLKTIIRK